MTPTLVALHAHPDDEALLTAGTLARAAAEGNRVVLVTATDGDLGLADDRFHEQGLGRRRLAELRASAEALGVHRLEWLGHADSGEGPGLAPDPPDQRRWVRVPVDEAAEQVAAIVRDEGAQVLLSYDASGGYGHRDHLHVHRVGRRVAELTGVRLLEATAPREIFAGPARLARALGRLPFLPTVDVAAWLGAYTPRAAITHRLDVRPYAAAKRASMRAHASQAQSDEVPRTLALLLRLPEPLYRRLLGVEWYHDPAVPPGRPLRTDLWEDLR